MKKPVWHSTEKGTAREEFVAFAAGRDVVSLPMADDALIPFDLWTNRAHAHGLYRIGVYTQEELAAVLHCLNDLEEQWQRGEWRLDPKLEDVHINIESCLSESCGETIGGKLHSGRSRNDQVATDMKLFAREVTLALLEETLVLLRSLIDHAAEYAEAVMPGYTHHRKATLTTWGHWCASYAQGLLRDAQRFMDACRRLNCCPLGAAASYGTTWNPDRAYLAERLAFDSVQENTLDAIMSRGEAEADIAQAAGQLLKRLSTIAQDLILFSTDEFGYLALPADFTTGSSIMPQKRNPDFAEAIKGKAHLVFGSIMTLLSMNSGNLSGYNKDIQWSKYVFMDVARESQGAASLLANVFQGIVVHREAMERAARQGFLNAVDIADHLARSRRLPFRLTYHIISDAVGLSREGEFTLPVLNELLQRNQIPALSPEEFDHLSNPRTCVDSRNHAGAPHPEQVRRHLAEMKNRVEQQETWLEAQRRRIRGEWERCRQV